MFTREERRLKSAEYLAIQMRRALAEEARRVRQLENEDVRTFKALRRLEEILNETQPKDGAVHSEDRAQALASIQRLQRVVDMRCAEIANIWETRVESLMACAEELRLLTSGQDPKTS